ncbi:MAG: IclR family transcriptional regulator [Syntrophobacteraceae bacterium]
MKLASIEKCLSIIDLLSNSPHGLRLSEIGNALNLPSSSVHHILSTLLPHDFVNQDPATRKYALGYRFLEMSRRILDHFDIRHLARYDLRQLQDLCGQTVHLAVLQHNKVIYIDKVSSSVGLSLATYVGFATDPHAAAGGKVLLSELPESELKRIFPTGRLKQYGKKTITGIPDLLQELGKIRRQGYALDDEEYYEGVRCIAAPIRAGGKIVAALSITGSIFAMTDERIGGEYKDMVVQTASNISARLQW